MWRELLGHLSNPSYTARASVADCIASCPTSQQVSGLVLLPEESVLPYLPAILGSDASGLIGCLQSADWQVRRSAVCAIKAVILVLGRALSDSDLLRVHQAVLAVKYDVAKNVRASAADCLPVLTQLMVGYSLALPDGLKSNQCFQSHVYLCQIVHDIHEHRCLSEDYRICGLLRCLLQLKNGVLS